MNRFTSGGMDPEQTYQSNIAESAKKIKGYGTSVAFKELD